MSAKRRNRKYQSKRSNSDDPYTQRYRAASDGAKAARAAARSRSESGTREGEDREVVDVREVKDLVRREGSLKGLAAKHAVYDEVSFDPSEGGILEGAFTYGPDVHDGDLIEVVQLDGVKVRGIALVHASEALPGYRIEVQPLGPEEALRAEGAPDAEALVERGAEAAPGLPPAEQVAESPELAGVRDAEDLAFAAESGSVDILEAILKAKEGALAEYRRRHIVFFEAEVNTVPTHVGSAQCYCTLGTNHWIELGEI